MQLLDTPQAAKERKLFTELFTDSYVQTFDDHKDRKDPGRVRLFPMSEYEANFNRLWSLNENGAGVYFSVNPCAGGRKAESVTEVRWLYADLDEGTKDAQMKRIMQSPIKPDMILQSARGYHLYWRCAVRIEDFDDLEKSVTAYFNGDVAAALIHQVLRFPGFYHMKQTAELPPSPYMVHILEPYAGQTHSYDEMVETFCPKPEYNDAPGTGLEPVRAIPIERVLAKMSGVDIKRGVIFEDGKGTSGVIHRKNNTVTRFSGKPGGGSTIDIAMHYKRLSVGDAIKWLRTEFNIPSPRPLSTRDVFTKKNLWRSVPDAYDLILDNINANSLAKIIKTGIPELDAELRGIMPTDLVIISADTGVGKSQMAGNIADEALAAGKRVAYFDLENDIQDWFLRRLARKIYLKTGKYVSVTDLGISEIFESNPEYGNQLAYLCDDINGRLQMYTNEELLTADGYVSAIDALPAVDLIVLDHLHYFDFENENENTGIGKIMRKIRVFTKTRRIPAVVVAHMRKRNHNDEPSMDDIFGSSTVAKEANVVILLSRKDDKIHINLAKGRGRGLFSKTWEATVRDGHYYDLTDTKNSSSVQFF